MYKLIFMFCLSLLLGLPPSLAILRVHYWFAVFHGEGLCAFAVVWGVTPGKSISMWWLDTWCAEVGLWDGRYLWSLWPDGHSLVWGDLCHIGHKFPDGVLCTSHSPMCLNNEPCTYVQGIATHSYMHHPVTVKRSCLLKGSFERVICCLLLM